MLHPFLAPLLALLLLAEEDPKVDQASDASREARVEVHEGRAVGVRKGAAERTLRRGEPWVTEGEVHLEVGAGAELQVLWPGRGSLQVWGPASLQWGPVDPELATGPDDLAIRMFDLAWADLETRRGNHQLQLPGGWRARLGAVAIHLRGLPSGPVELRHHAGRPVRLDWRGKDLDARPPITVYPGSNVRLDRPQDPPRSDKRNVNAWGAVEWPWRRPDRPRPSLTPGRFYGGTAPPQTGQAATVPTRPSVPLRVTLTPPPIEEAEETAVAPVPFDPGAWRGIPREDLSVVGPLVVQRAPGASLRALASGRWMVVLDAMATGPVWVFGPRRDFQLLPGALAVFEPDGGLAIQTGTVGGVEPSPGRPPSSTLRR